MNEKQADQSNLQEMLKRFDNIRSVLCSILESVKLPMEAAKLINLAIELAQYQKGPQVKESEKVSIYNYSHIPST